jgi:hypothetical protein
MSRKNPLNELLSLLYPADCRKRSSPRKARKRSKRTPPLFDFRTEGPPRRLCKLCLRRYQDWAVSAEDWAKLPEEHRQSWMCKDDYCRLLREAGHDPVAINFSDEPWKQRVARWQETSNMPPDHAHIVFDELGPSGPIREILECEVICELDPGIWAVRLRSQSSHFRALRNGVPYLAVWDRMRVSSVTGRPMFQPLYRLRSLRGLEQQLAVAQERDGAQMLAPETQNQIPATLQSARRDLG